MPVIPRLTNNQVTQAPLQIAARQPAPNGLHDLGGAIQDTAGVLFEVKERQQLQADRTAFMEADRVTDAAANDLILNAQKAQFKDAIGIGARSLQEFDKKTQEIEGSLATNRQKVVYREAAQQRRAQLQLQIGRHEVDETERYHAKSREDYKNQAITNAVTAYQDPEVIEDQINKVRATLDQTPGIDDAQRSVELSARRSEIYAGVIDRYLSNDQVDKASSYYESIKPKVDGPVAADIERGILSAKKRQEAERELAARTYMSEQRELLSDDLSDAFAARQIGLPAELPSRARFMAAYGADGAKRYTEASATWGVYDVVAQAALQAPADAAATLARLKPTDQVGAAGDVKRYEAAVNLWNEQRKALESDPVGALLSRDAGLRDKAENARDPQSTRAFLQSVRARQEALGVEKPRLLPLAAADQIARQLTFNPETPGARMQALQQLQATYGREFPQIVSEIAPKIEGSARVLVNMTPEDGKRLDAALAQDPAKTAKLLPPQAASDIKREINIELESFAQTLADNPDSEARVLEHYEAALAFAQSLVLRGTSPGEAAKIAADAVVNRRYQYRDTMRIPAELDADRIEQAARARQVEKQEFAIDLGLHSDATAAQEDIREHVAKHGYWITNEDETGLVLRIPHRSGQGEVYDKDGQRIEYTWEELLTAGARAQTPLPTDSESMRREKAMR